MGDSTKHAVLSPSSAKQWSSCSAAPAMQYGMPNTSSEFSEDGTSKHEVAETCLTFCVSVESLIGQTFNGFELSAEDADILQTGYINPVIEMADGGELFIEQRLSISHITGEQDAFGTSDVVIVHDDEIVICDLKWGMGVQVDAEDNLQLCMYALAVIDKHYRPWTRMVILQPRMNHTSEWRIPTEDLIKIGKKLSSAAKRANNLLEIYSETPRDVFESEYKNCFTPSVDNCRWCKAKLHCKALREFTFKTVTDEFDDLDSEDLTGVLQTAVSSVRNRDEEYISKVMPHLDLIEMFCKAVRAKGESIIHKGGHIPGYKLVLGKHGNRDWRNESTARTNLELMGLEKEEIFKFSLKSPTQIEKLLKEKGGEWKSKYEDVAPYVTRSEPHPTVVPDSDKREEIKPASDDFDNESDDFDDEI